MNKVSICYNYKKSNIYRCFSIDVLKYRKIVRKGRVGGILPPVEERLETNPSPMTLWRN